MIARRQKFLFSLFCLLSVLSATTSNGQSTGGCPPNIGFEDGSFGFWECYSGKIRQDGVVDINSTPPVYNQHEMYTTNGAILANDPYGGFPVNCPNGSGYSIRLGNDEVNAGAERVSYTFTIPAGQDNYSIIYHYAVVIENPNHQPHQQPKFQTEVFDVTMNEYVQCASFQFIAGPNLPGFSASPLRNNVYYKPWAPVTINLSGYAGRTIRLDFTNNDCSQGGHFGYAYLDIDENCASPIKGNTYCGNIDALTLTAPFGFEGYNWYNANFTQVLGTTNVLVMNPPPAPGTVLALELIPFPGLGCLDTLYTTIQSLPDELSLVLPDSVTGCLDTGMDLTAPWIKNGSTPNLVYKYYNDPLGLVPIIQPKSVKNPGTYFVQATNSVGCFVIKPLKVVLLQAPSVVVAPLVSACFPGAANLTRPEVTAGSATGLTYSYWKDGMASVPLLKPDSITASGNYFIRGVTQSGCASIRSVNVQIAQLKTNAVDACGTADLTMGAVTSGSTPGFLFSYWKNADTTQAVTTPAAVAEPGTYYIRGDNGGGCQSVVPVSVSIRPTPPITVFNPAPVHYPAIINLTQLIGNSTNAELEYFTDAALTKFVSAPEKVDRSGVYYVRAKNNLGCATVKSISVTVIPPPVPATKAPNAFSPNGDGVNELFQVDIDGFISHPVFTIFNRWGQPVFRTNNPDLTWNGRLGSSNAPLGTYYWVVEATDTYRQKRMVFQGSITLLR